MNTFTKILKACAQLLLAVVIVCAGCKPNNAAPTPLALAQIPSEMRKVFTNAKPEITQTVSQMLEALQSKNYPAAYQAAQFICSEPQITKAQQLVTARAMLQINELVKQASAQGDAAASAFIGYQRHNR